MPLDISTHLTRLQMMDLIELMPPCSCGGKLDLRDFGPREPGEESPDPDFRFEVSCDGCLECDPNGYATPEAAAERGPQYFA
jgi:hypothetical protein